MYVTLHTYPGSEHVTGVFLDKKRAEEYCLICGVKSSFSEIEEHEVNEEKCTELIPESDAPKRLTLMEMQTFEDWEK